MMGKLFYGDMSEYDRQNLEFLLTADDDVLIDWFDTIEDDDVSYAFELLETAKLNLIDQATELSDLSQAQDALITIMEKR
jgi:hypothetical protein